MHRALLPSRAAPAHGPSFSAKAPFVAGWCRACRLFLLASPCVSAQAGWLSPGSRASWRQIMGAAEQAGSRAAKLGPAALDHAAAHVKALPVKADGAALAAQATQEGHWRFVNQAGETLHRRHAGRDEARRLGAAARGQGRREALALRHRGHRSSTTARRSRTCPRARELFVVVGDESYRILRRGEGAAERLFARGAPQPVRRAGRAQGVRRGGVAARAPAQQAPTCACWRWSRAARRRSPRRRASIPPASAPLVDVIDPASLPAALGSVRGQTVLVTGRVDGQLLYVQPSSGPEKSLLLRDLLKAAEEADVNLVVLQPPSTPRQPGGRNWLWQKVEVKGLDEALQQRAHGRFPQRAGGARAAASWSSATPSGTLRTAARYQAGDRHSRRPADAADRRCLLRHRLRHDGPRCHRRRAGQPAQRRAPAGARPAPHPRHSLRPAVRLSGVHVSSACSACRCRAAWWRRMWPPEAASEYAGRAGYWAARMVRGAVFLFVFLPLTAPVAAPYSGAPDQRYGDGAGALVALADRRSAPRRARAAAAAAITAPIAALAASGRNARKRSRAAQACDAAPCTRQSQAVCRQTGRDGDAQGQDAVHHGREPRHRPRHRAAGRARRRQHRHRRQDGRAASQARGHHLHGGQGDRGGRRQGAADRLRHPLRGAGAGGGGQDGRRPSAASTSASTTRRAISLTPATATPT